MTWRPANVSHSPRNRPEVGEVVAYDYRAWRVMHVIDVEPNADELGRLHWRMNPYAITLRLLYGKKGDENSAGDIGLRVRAGAYHPFPIYPNGRVPLCSCHAEPWPCIESEQEAQAQREIKRAEREMSLLPGCCPACQEPVTSRQKSITFGGPNVRNPLAEGPTFHLRRKCYGSAANYEEAWVNDELGRARSLLTLRCEGTVVVHHDGSAECFGAENSECPSIYARHRAYMACYIQSSGCGRECPRQGHPGTRIAGHPDHPRAITKAQR